MLEGSYYQWLACLNCAPGVLLRAFECVNTGAGLALACGVHYWVGAFCCANAMCCPTTPARRRPFDPSPRRFPLLPLSPIHVSMFMRMHVSVHVCSCSCPCLCPCSYPCTSSCSTLFALSQQHPHARHVRHLCTLATCVTCARSPRASLVHARHVPHRVAAPRRLSG
jgi:hypothetical protein